MDINCVYQMTMFIFLNCYYTHVGSEMFFHILSTISAKNINCVFMAKIAVYRKLKTKKQFR